jgi:gliding motility-associated-like protein
MKSFLAIRNLFVALAMLGLSVSATAQTDTLGVDEGRCNLFTPTAFTPNEDEVNDRFIPIFSCEVTDYELTVWDRYGKQIYRTTDQKQGWNGSAMNEYYVDTGVYTWILRYRPQRNGGLPEQMQGSITLLR